MFSHVFMQDLEINRLEAGTAEAPTVQRLINGATRMPWGQAMSCKKMGFEPVDMELS
jgi:hypothetical protein